MSEQTVANTRAQMDRLQLEVSELKGQKGVEDITVGDYLLARLDQLQVTVSTSWDCAARSRLISASEHVRSSWRLQPRLPRPC